MNLSIMLKMLLQSHKYEININMLQSKLYSIHDFGQLKTITSILEAIILHGM